jgi:ComF family protein
VCDDLLEAAEVRNGEWTHRKCKTKLKPVGDNVCYHCGRPVRREKQEYCHDCTRGIQQKQSPFWKGTPFSCYQQGKALFLYQDEAKKMMYRFKYGNRRTYADFFADEAQKQYGDWITGKSVEAVVPVPMYRKKEKQRGYNQADVFAKKLADALGLAYEPAAVQRIVDTKPQKELGDEERKNNLKNAFHVEKFIVKYKYILLVDDIYTTGSTAEAVARQLLAAGVEKVFFLSVCIGNGY